AQLRDRVHRGIEVTEHSQHTRRGRRVEDGGQRVRELHDTLAFPRCGAGSTSFTSEIDTVGKFFTNNRNHMKNQPKLPAMMPQSAHVGLYVARSEERRVGKECRTRWARDRQKKRRRARGWYASRRKQ